MTPENILFSNDAFGQHYASDERLDTECDLPEAYIQARKILCKHRTAVRHADGQGAGRVRWTSHPNHLPQPRHHLDKTYPRHPRPVQIVDVQRIRRHGGHRVRHYVAFDGGDGHTPSKTVSLPAASNPRLYNLHYCHNSDINRRRHDGKVHRRRFPHPQQQYDALRFLFPDLL